MDENRLIAIADFVKDFRTRPRKNDDEFTLGELSDLINRALTTVRGWLVQAEKEGILTSRVDGRKRYYSVSNKEEFQLWLKQRNQSH